MRQSLFLIIIISFSCSSNVSTCIHIPNEEPAVYTAILDSIVLKNNIYSLLVLDSTITTPTLCHLQAGYAGMPSKIPEDSNRVVFEQMLSEFKLLKTTSVPISIKSIKSNVQLHTISFHSAYNQRDSLRLQGGLYAFSRVLFSSDSTWSIVLFETFLGHLNGSGQYILLKKSKTKWFRASSATRWLS